MELQGLVESDWFVLKQAGAGTLVRYPGTTKGSLQAAVAGGLFDGARQIQLLGVKFLVPLTGGVTFDIVDSAGAVIGDLSWAASASRHSTDFLPGGITIDKPFGGKLVVDTGTVLVAIHAKRIA